MGFCINRTDFRFLDEPENLQPLADVHRMVHNGVNRFPCAATKLAQASAHCDCEQYCLLHFDSPFAKTRVTLRNTGPFAIFYRFGFGLDEAEHLQPFADVHRMVHDCVDGFPRAAAKLAQTSNGRDCNHCSFLHLFSPSKCPNHSPGRGWENTRPTSA